MVAMVDLAPAQPINQKSGNACAQHIPPDSKFLVLIEPCPSFPLLLQTHFTLTHYLYSFSRDLRPMPCWVIRKAHQDSVCIHYCGQAVGHNDGCHMRADGT